MLTLPAGSKTPPLINVILWLSSTGMVCNASAGVSGSRCVKAVLPNLFRFRSHLQSIAAFPFTWLWLYGRCDIVQHLVFVVRPRYFLYFIHCMLSALQQILLQSSKYDLDTDSASQYFLSVNTNAILKEERRVFLLARVVYDWTENFALCTNIRAVGWRIVGLMMNTVLVP